MDGYITLPILDETGYVVLEPHDTPLDPAEWRDLEYVAWRSAGVTRFAPLTSAAGDIDCNGFWNHTPPRTDKDGVWIASQAQKAPTLVRLAKEPGANVGRCRVVELQPNTYADALYNLHHDDNNRLNPPGTGWVVRGYINLTDDPDSLMLLRTDRTDPTTEVRIPLPMGARVIVDTQRFWHAVWHRGDAPRYGLVTSFESGPELDAYIRKAGGRTRIEPVAIDPAVAAEAEAEFRRRDAERERILSEMGRALDGA